VNSISLFTEQLRSVWSKEA